MPPREPFGPKLLVSVRSCEEAFRAIAGGADILDVKEPSRGSLGMAELDVVRDIASAVGRNELNVPLSVALGELVDWWNGSELPQIPRGMTFAKLGLSNTAGIPDWRVRWYDLRNRIDRARPEKLKWVAVTYADSDNAQSPNVDEVISAAIESECQGLLIDTWSKSGRTLLDFIDPQKLGESADRCHGADLFLALAGSLKSDHLSELKNVGADVIAIRSAACRNNSRCEEIDQSAVRLFRMAMA